MAVLSSWSGFTKIETFLFSSGGDSDGWCNSCWMWIRSFLIFWWRCKWWRNGGCPMMDSLCFLLLFPSFLSRFVLFLLGCYSNQRFVLLLIDLLSLAIIIRVIICIRSRIVELVVIHNLSLFLLLWIILIFTHIGGMFLVECCMGFKV